MYKYFFMIFLTSKNAFSSSFDMGRPKNEIVWNNFTKSGLGNKLNGATCKHCKQSYMIANVNKMTTHLLSCFKCPEEIRVEIRKEQSSSGKSSQNVSSCSSAESECSDISAPSTSKIARKGIESYFDNVSIQENVSPNSETFHYLMFRFSQISSAFYF